MAAARYPPSRAPLLEILRRHNAPYRTLRVKAPSVVPSENVIRVPYCALGTQTVCMLLVTTEWHGPLPNYSVRGLNEPDVLSWNNCYNETEGTSAD